MTATEFLISKEVVHPDKKDLIIEFNDGSKVSLIELLDSYHLQKSKEIDNKKSDGNRI